MKLKECSAMRLLKIAKKKKLICFGAGGHLHYFFNTYNTIGLEKYVEFIVDNDVNKIGTMVNLNGCDVEICSPEKIKKIDFNKRIILITALKVQEIFSQIQNLCQNRKGVCFKTPAYKYSAAKLVEKVMCKLPLKDIIVIKGEGDTCDNTMSLYNYIAQNDYFGKYTLVQLCEHPDRFMDSKKDKNIYVRAYMNSNGFKEVVKYYYYLGRAKYIIYENMHIKKLRSEQTLVYLNHGSPPLKSTKGIINLPSDLNYAICPSEWSVPIYCEQYSINKERVIVCGSPRTDILFKEQTECKMDKYIGRQYNKTILWVPTFRQRKNSNRVDSDAQYELGIPVIADEKQMKELEVFLSEKDILILFKPHKIQDMQYVKASQSEYFKIISTDEMEQLGISVYELMKCADAMLTDYSTIAFDYMLTNKPIGYTIDDIQEYRLGFSVPNVLELMPGKKISDFGELIAFIDDVANDEDEFRTEREIVNSKVHDYIDGHNCERVCKMLGIQ